MNKAYYQGKLARATLKPKTANPYSKVYSMDKEGKKAHENHYWWLAGYNDEQGK